MKILEEKSVLKFLQKRNLVTQYKKAKYYLEMGYLGNVDSKVRRPKMDKIYSFRINKQYRVWCVFDGEILRVFEIDDHQ